MRKTMIVVAGLMGAALAAPALHAQDSTAAPAAGNAMAPAAGANSFTEGQAKSRIEDAGFTNVSDLKKDDQGVWRAKASKDGQSVPVSLDFKGNVVGK